MIVYLSIFILSAISPAVGDQKIYFPSAENKTTIPQTDKTCPVYETCELLDECPYIQEKYHQYLQATSQQQSQLGDHLKSIICNKDMKAFCCPKLGPEWSAWSAWSTCSATCGIATKLRKRICNNPFLHGGKSCPGFKEEAIKCNLPSCEIACPAFNINTDDRRDAELLKSIVSEEECSKKCREKTTCKFWSWRNNDAGTSALECVLMTGYGFTTSENNVISGSKTCNPAGLQIHELNSDGYIECQGGFNHATMTYEDSNCPEGKIEQDCGFIEDDGKQNYHCWQTRYDGTICEEPEVFDPIGPFPRICQLPLPGGDGEATNCYKDPLTGTEHINDCWIARFLGFNYGYCLVGNNLSTSRYLQVKMEADEMRMKFCEERLPTLSLDDCPCEGEPGSGAGFYPLNATSATASQELVSVVRSKHACPFGYCKRGRNKCCPLVYSRRGFYICPLYC